MKGAMVSKVKLTRCQLSVEANRKVIECSTLMRKEWVALHASHYNF